MPRSSNIILSMSRTIVNDATSHPLLEGVGCASQVYSSFSVAWRCSNPSSCLCFCDPEGQSCHLWPWSSPASRRVPPLLPAARGSTHSMALVLLNSAALCQLLALATFGLFPFPTPCCFVSLVHRQSFVLVLVYILFFMPRLQASLFCHCLLPMLMLRPFVFSFDSM